MKPATRVFRASFRESLCSPRSAIIALLIVAVTIAGCTEMLSRQSGHMSAVDEQTSAEESSRASVYPLTPGTAHAQIWDAINYRYFRSAPMFGGPLLPMRYAAVWMGFFLPILALLLTFDSVSADLESGRLKMLQTAPAWPRAVLLARVAGRIGAAGVALALGLAASLVVVGRLTLFAWTSTQLLRIALFLLFVLAYMLVFSLVGVLASALARYSARALRVSVIIVVSVFGIHLLLENLASLVPLDTPQPPEMSSHVRHVLTSAERLGTRGVVGIDDEVAAYRDSLEEHSEIVYEAVRRRYQQERWLNLVSPSHWLVEVSSQLLQDEYRVITDVFRGMPFGYHDGNALPTLRFLILEIAWALVCLTGLTVAVSRVLLKLEV